MPIDHGFPADRTTLTKLLFPDDVPSLWSPILVFYDETGRIDRDRQLETSKNLALSGLI
jgi:hypothetical protein